MEFAERDLRLWHFKMAGWVKGSLQNLVTLTSMLIAQEI